MEAEYYELLYECLKKLQATGKQRNLKNEFYRPSPTSVENHADSRLQKHNYPRWIRSNVETDDDSGVRT